MIVRRSGHLTNEASVAELTAVLHNAIYSASKHALVGFSRSLGPEGYGSRLREGTGTAGAPYLVGANLAKFRQ